MADSSAKVTVSDVTRPLAIHLSSKQLATQQANRLAEFGTAYTSKGTVASQADGVLIGASATLLSVMSQLKQAEPNQHVEKLQQELIHEVKSFEFECQSAHYHQDTILAARYILCVALDETIEKSSWQKQWENYRLVSAFQLENWCGDGFFQLLENLSAHPMQHGELLELMYYCLSLGFVGKYRQIIDGARQVNVIRDRLYQLIRDNHDDFKMSLSEFAPVNESDTVSDNIPLPRWWRVPLLTAIGLTIAYVGFSYLLNVVTEPALQHALQLSIAPF